MNDSYFIGLVDANYAAWSTMDFDQIDPFYARTPELLFFDLGHIFVGWDAYRHSAGDALSHMESFHLQRKPNFETLVFQDETLVVTADKFEVTAQVKNPDKSITTVKYSGGYTAVWQQEPDGRWLIIHEHQSKAGDESDKKAD